MSGEIPDYLKKNFDPNSLSIPQLRSILKDHGVEDVPAPNQPKRVFIKLFNNEIYSNRDEILKSLNITETTKKRKGGAKKSGNEDSEYLKSDLPQALRGKSESPVSPGKDVKNKRVSFGVNELKVRYEQSNPTAPSKKEEIPVKEDKKKPLIQSTINKLNEEVKTSNSYLKSYNSEKTGIEKGNIKRARKTFSESSSPDIEIKKQSRIESDDDEPSQKKRKHNEKLTSGNANTSSSNIFQKYNPQTQNVTSSSSGFSKIPTANIIYAENMDDEEDDEDYVYHSSPSVSSPSEHEINDEEMEDLEKESANIEPNYQDQSVSATPIDTGITSSKLDNSNYNQIMNENNPINNRIEKQPSFTSTDNPNNSFNKYNKLENPKSSINANNSFSRSSRLDKPNLNFQKMSSLSYENPNNSFSKSNKLDKPNTSFQKGSNSFTRSNPNKSFNRSSKLEKSKYSPNSSFQKGFSSFLKGDTSPYNTSFNDKPKINISYDMSPIQSSQSSVLYEDNLLNQVASQDNSNIIGNLYEAFQMIMMINVMVMNPWKLKQLDVYPAVIYIIFLLP